MIDTGPLIALLSPRDQYHGWAVDVMDQLEAPFYTCEPVLTETMHFLGRSASAGVELVQAGVLRLGFRLEPELQSVRRLLTTYRSMPMSLADACLVRMTELHQDCALLTTDSDFRIYRRNGRQVIPTIAPQLN
jgi:predicted nucleic acid-binding protein